MSDISNILKNLISEMKKSAIETSDFDEEYFIVFDNLLNTIFSAKNIINKSIYLDIYCIIDILSFKNINEELKKKYQKIKLQIFNKLFPQKNKHISKNIYDKSIYSV